MRNILGETSYDRLSGYRLESLRLVKDSNIKDKVVLDIGCGNGWCEWNYLKRGVRKMYAIDISKRNVRIAKTMNSKLIVFKIGDAIDLPFKNDMFDTVVSWEVLEHIPANSEKKMFDEVHRVLKPRGYFFLSTPNRNVFSTTLDPAWWLTGHRNYSRKEIINYADNAGFEVDEIGRAYLLAGRFWK